MFERATDQSIRIAILQTPRYDSIERGAGNDAQLPDLRYGAGQSPIGNSEAHAALNNFWCFYTHMRENMPRPLWQ